MKPKIFLIAFSFLFGMAAIASDIKDVSVLTDRILVVHFLDGYIEYHGYHQTGEDDKTIKDELDVNSASVLANYSITSTDDPSPVFSVGTP